MRVAFAICAALVLTGLPGRASAKPLSPLARMASGQMSFEGLDLSSDDDKPKKGGKKGKKKGKKDKDKGKPDKPDETPAAAPDLGLTPTPTPGPKDDKAGQGDKTVPDLGAKPEPKKNEPPPKPAPTMSFEAIDVNGKSAERQKIDAAAGQFKRQQYEECALALEDILKDPNNAAIQPEAKYLLGKALYRLGLYHSSLATFRDVLAAGPSGKFFKSSLEWLFFIAHKTVNEEIILDEVAKYSNYEFPPKFQSEFRYLLAKYHFGRGKALVEAGRQAEGQKELDEATKLVLAFSKSDPFYGKSQYLNGLVNFDLGKQAVALESFKEVVRANNPRAGANWDEHLRELGFMQLARTHYGSRQNRYAIYYFERVPPGSDQWLESLFEASWAHFRIGQYEKALGNMITLQAPFFRDEYFPEALILKAVIYYENCRYKEARAILDDFDQRYHPVRDELEKIVKGGEGKDSQHYFEVLEDIEKKQGDTADANNLVLGRVLKLALTDKELKGTNDSIMEIEREQDAISTKKEIFRYSDLAKDLLEGRKQERAALVQRAGLIAKAKLQNELEYLTGLLSQGLRIQFETTTKEKEVIEANISGGSNKPDTIHRNPTTTAVADDEQYWPYEGEYWRDELGTYQYTLTKGCKGVASGGDSDGAGGGSP